MFIKKILKENLFIVKTILFLLTKKEKKQAIYLLFMLFGMAVFDVVGVASIMPFLSLAGDTTVVEDSAFLSWLYEYSKQYGVGNYADFLIFLGITSFITIFVASIYKVLTVYLMNRFVELRRHSIAMRLLEAYTHQNYEYFVTRSSAEISKNILSEVDQVVSNTIRPFFYILAYGLILIIISMLLLYVNFKIALITMVTFSSLYILIYFSFRNKLKSYATLLRKTNEKRFSVIGEVFGGIKYLKFSGNEKKYLEYFKPSSKVFSSIQSGYQTISATPNYLIEIVIYGAMISLSLYFLIFTSDSNTDNLGRALPIIGLYAFSAYKAKPSVHHIFQGLSALKYSKEILLALYKDLVKYENKDNSLSSQKVIFEKSIQFKNISYSYPNTNTKAINGLNMEIKYGDCIGIVGRSGSGKTTLLDIFLGLIKPLSGKMMVDGVEINSLNVREWQKIIGYVPQDIFLTNGTFLENISFNQDEEEIDIERAINAAKLANLDNLIESKDDTFRHVVGERGVKLSGGQKQRIGLARAFYRNPNILAFDEATSALDSETEKNVMESLKKISNNKTMLIIAHRISTVKDCDHIILMEKGNVIAEGKYDELSKNKEFKKIAGLI